MPIAGNPPLKALSECWHALPSWRGLLSLRRGPQRRELRALCDRTEFEFVGLAGTKVLTKLSFPFIGSCMV